MGRVALGFLLGLAGSLASACALPRAYGEDVSLHTILSGGYRALDHDTFDGHPVYALGFATSDARSGWGYELGGTYGNEDVGGPREHSAEFNELYLGLRRSWQPEHTSARPYVALGGSFTRIEHDLHSPRSEFEDEGGTAYVRGGVLWPLGPIPLDTGTEVMVGLDARGVVGDDYNAAELALVLAFGR